MSASQPVLSILCLSWETRPTIRRSRAHKMLWGAPHNSNIRKRNLWRKSHSHRHGIRPRRKPPPQEGRRDQWTLGQSKPSTAHLLCGRQLQVSPGDAHPLGQRVVHEWVEDFFLSQFSTNRTKICNIDCSPVETFTARCREAFLTCPTVSSTKSSRPTARESPATK